MISQKGTDYKFPSLRHLEVKNQEISERIKLSGIPKRYSQCFFDSFGDIPEQISAQYKQVKQYADNLNENIKQGKGLLLKGQVGTMKTSLAVAVLHEAIANDKSAMFITMSSLLDTIFSLKDVSKDEWAKFENRIRKVSILLLDDLGAEYSEGWVQTKVDSIVSERYNAMLPMIITTNLTGEKMAKTYAARIVDRIQYTSEVITFTGESLRRKVQT